MNWILSQTESWGLANAWIFRKRLGKHHCYFINSVPSYFLRICPWKRWLSPRQPLFKQKYLALTSFSPSSLYFALCVLVSFELRCSCEFLHMPLCRYVRKWLMNIFECLIDGFKWGCVGLHCINVKAPKVLIMSRTDTNILKSWAQKGHKRYIKYYDNSYDFS